MLLFSLGLVFLNERFLKGRCELDWNATLLVDECSLSAPSLRQYCAIFNQTDSNLSVSARMRKPIRQLPMFIFFTAKIEYPAEDSSIRLDVGDFSISLGLKGKKMHYELENMGENGTVFYEKYLTHSFSLSIRGNREYDFYVDGYPLHSGTVQNVRLPVDTVSVEVKNSNTSIELGPVLVSDTVDRRWQVLIDNVLRYKARERGKWIHDRAVEEEREIFGKLLPEESDTELPEMQSESQVDPRNFKFPFTMDENNIDKPKEESRMDNSIDTDSGRKYVDYEEAEIEL